MDKATSDSEQSTPILEHEEQRECTGSTIQSSTERLTSKPDAKAETPSHEIQNVISQPASQPGVEIHNRNFRVITPLPHNNKQSNGGYIISKVTSDIKTLQPSPTRSFGKVLLLPKQAATKLGSSHDRGNDVCSQQNQPGIFLSLNATRPRQESQVCNKISLQPNLSFPFQMTCQSNAVIPIINNFPQTIQTMRPVAMTASQSTSTSIETLFSISSLDDNISQEATGAISKTVSLNNIKAVRQNVQTGVNATITEYLPDKTVSTNNIKTSQQNIQAGLVPATIAYMPDKTVCKAHQSLSETNKKEGCSTTIPQYYRDIRPSVSKFVFSSLIEHHSEYNVDTASIPTTLYDETDTSKNVDTAMSENCTNETQTFANSSLEESKHDTEASLNTQQPLEKREKAPTSVAGTLATQGCKITDLSISNGTQQKKTPLKPKRNRKPKLAFSPSGNDILDANTESDEGQLKTKTAKKRKTTKGDLDSQYFDALHRTIAKKAKVLNTDYDSKGQAETAGSPSNLTTSCRKLQPPMQDSDYKLKQKMLLNSVPMPNEIVNSHHLLKKIDPNDPERKKSLAVFSNKYWVQDSKVEPYKLSMASAPSVLEKSSDICYTKTLDLKSKEECGCESLKSVIHKNAISHQSVSDNRADLLELPKSNVQEEIKDDNLIALIKAKEKENPSPVEQNHEQETLTECTENEGQRYDTPTANIHTSNSCQFDSVSDNLISSNSPSVVLQRISGVTPNTTVHLGHLLKQTPLRAPSERTDTLHTNVKDIPLNTDIAINTETKKRRTMKSPKKFAPQKKTMNKNTIALVNTQSSLTSKDESLPENSKELNKTSEKDASSNLHLHTIKTDDHLSDNCHKNKTPAKVSEEIKKKQEEGILHKLLFSDDDTLKDSNRHAKKSESQTTENKDEQTELSKSAGSQVQGNIKELNTLVLNKTEMQISDLTGKDIISNQNIQVGMRLSQSIPVFFNSKGRLMPGPMPITPETYRYLLSKGSAGNSLLPRPNVIQPTHENRSGTVAAEQSKATDATLNTSAEIKDPTGILTTVSQDQGTEIKHNSFSSKGKTVAELLIEKRSQQFKQATSVINSSAETTNTCSSMAIRENKVSNMKVRDENKPVTSPKDRIINDDVKVCASTASFETLSDSPGTLLNKNSGLNVSEFRIDQANLKKPKGVESVSPFIYRYDDKYSKPVLPLAVSRRISSETVQSPSIKEGNMSKEFMTSPCIPLKIVIPSPQKPSFGSPSPSIKLPVTVQKVADMPSQSPSGLTFSSTNNVSDTIKLGITYNNTVPNHANQSFAVRVGDKMYIIRPAMSVEQAKGNNIETGQPTNTLPAPKLEKHPKSSKKRKSPRSNEKRKKACKTTNYQKGVKKNLKKMLKKNKTPFDELIQSLGLEHNKGNAKKWRKRLAHKITYSSTPSPVASTHNTLESPVSVKQEPVTPDLTTSETIRNERTPDNHSSKSNLKTVKVVSKKATIMQIFKVANKSSKFYMHTAKLNFTTGSNNSYHRWFPHSDYPCTLHLKNSDTIYQIDVECLRSGFYLVSEMDKNILTANLRDRATVTAVLSLYPPDINIMPDESLSVAVGQISDYDESEQPIPNENGSDAINQSIDSIIKSILKLDTFKDIEHIADQRYGSVKNVCMSPKYHSNRFYTQELFDCFTPDRNTDLKSFFGPKSSDSGITLKSVPSKDKLEELCESEASLNSKAQELKVKQTKLYEKCSLLKDQLQSGTGLLLASDVARGVDSYDEFDTDTSQDDGSITEHEFIVPETQHLLVHDSVKYKKRGRKKKVSDKQVDLEADTNTNPTVGKEIIQKMGEIDKPQFRRLTRSLSVSSNLHVDSKL